MKRNNLKLKKRQHNTADLWFIYGFYDLLEAQINALQLKDKLSHIWNSDKSVFNYDPLRDHDNHCKMKLKKYNMKSKVKNDCLLTMSHLQSMN